MMDKEINCSTFQQLVYERQEVFKPRVLGVGWKYSEQRWSNFISLQAEDGWTCQSYDISEGSGGMSFLNQG